MTLSAFFEEPVNWSIVSTLGDLLIAEGCVEGEQLDDILAHLPEFSDQNVSAALLFDLLQQRKGHLIVVLLKQLPDIVDGCVNQEQLVKAAA